MTKKKLEQLNTLMDELLEKFSNTPGLKTKKITSFELNGERMVRCKNDFGKCYWEKESKCNKRC